MAPSRRKGATSKAAAAAAACRQWKVGDLVLAKVKGFPAWPATVSEPEKWGYSRDRKKVLVYFFGTQQIAFCNPVDVEAFTEDKKQSLFVKRRGKGADFIRAVHEIIDCFEKLKTEQPVDGNSTDEVDVRSDNEVVELTKNHLEGEALNTIESSSKENLGDESEPEFENEAGAVAAKDDVSHNGEMLSVDPTSVEVMDVPVTKTYSTRRKIVGGRSRNGAVERRAPSARRLRSSLRTDPEVHQNRFLPSVPHSMNAGYGANTLRDRSARRNKMDGRPSDGLDTNNMEQPAFVSNGSTEEGDSEIATVDSGSVSLNEGSSVESGCKPVYRCAVQCESEIELSQRPEFQSSAVILKKKRKPSRKRLHTDLTESSAGLDKDTALETVTARTTDLLPGDLVKSDEKNSKELKDDGDEHLPLVKRARVRMGRSAPEGEVLDNEVLNDAKSPGASDKSLEQVPEGDGSCLQNSTCIKSDAYDSSPSKKCSAKRPPFWEIRKQFGGSLDGESALPPSKRLHRALEAMSAYAADDDKQDMDGLCKMKTSINGYCSSSKEVSSELSGIKFENNSDVGRIGSPASAVQEDATIVASAKVLVAREGLEHLSEVPALTTPVACDDSSAKVSYEDKCDVLDAVIRTPQKVESSNDCPSSTFVAHSANAKSDGELQGTFKCERPSPGQVMISDENCENEVVESEKPFEDPIFKVSGKSADCGSNDEVIMSSPGKGGMMGLGDQEAERGKNNKLCQVSLDVSIQENEESINMKEAGSASKNISATSSSSPEKVVDVSLKELHMSGLSSVSDDQFGDKAVSTTVSSSSLTDGMDSFARTSTPNTLTCNISTVDSSMHVSIGSSSPLPHQLHDKPRTGGKLSSRGEANVALGSFEAILGILKRTKESIGRATRVALDCAKCGVASKVVEMIAQKLENESSLHRRVDLFFLVDSVAQFSRGLKGHIGGIYPSAIQGVLPRLVSAAAPPGSSSQENRRQCLKVLRVWHERKILPESAIRPYIRELESFCGSSLSRSHSRRPMRTERSFDDPIREMEGMLVDEYGSNSSFQLPGFRMPAMLKDEEVSDSDGESFEAVTPEHPAGKPNEEEAILAIEKHKHILEDVDGELEMEDVSPVCEGGSASISYSVGTDSAQISRPDDGNSLGAPFHPPLPEDGPPSAPPLPTSPPPPPPSLPSVMPAPSSFPPPSSISNSAPSSVQSKCSMDSQNIKDNLHDTVFQQCTVALVHPAVSDAIHCQPSDGREIHAKGSLKVLDPASSRPSNNGAVSHPPFCLSNGVQPPDGASGKGFHLRPPHPAPSNQFSYVQADQRRDIATPYSNVQHHMQNAGNRNFSRDRSGMKSARREIGESWMPPSHYSGPCYPDGSRRHYATGPYPVPREPPLPSHKWGYPPRGMNRREVFTHRPPPDRLIPVTSRGPGFWRPR